MNKNHFLRPWFLSVTALWQDAVGFNNLKKMLHNDLNLYELLPGHQISIRESSWHSTFFAICKINGWDSKKLTAEENAISLLNEFTKKNQLLLEDFVNIYKEISIEAYELICFDSGSAIQFRDIDNSLLKFRESVKKILEIPIIELCDSKNESGFGKRWKDWNYGSLIDSLHSDTYKNSGGNAFGSVARSVNSNDANIIRWRQKFTPIVLKFNKLYLLHSDEMLTNRKAIETAFVISK